MNFIEQLAFKKVCLSLATPRLIDFLEIKTIPVGSTFFVERITHHLMQKFDKPNELEDAFLVTTSNSDRFWLPGRAREALQFALKNGGLTMFDNCIMINGGYQCGQNIFYLDNDFFACEEKYKNGLAKIFHATVNSKIPEVTIFGDIATTPFPVAIAVPEEKVTTSALAAVEDDDNVVKVNISSSEGDGEDVIF